MTKHPDYVALDNLANRCVELETQLDAMAEALRDIADASWQTNIQFAKYVARAALAKAGL